MVIKRSFAKNLHRGEDGCLKIIGCVGLILILCLFGTSSSSLCPEPHEEERWIRELYSMDASCAPNATLVIGKWIKDLSPPFDYIPGSDPHEKSLTSPGVVGYKYVVDSTGRVIPSTLTNLRRMLVAFNTGPRDLRQYPYIWVYHTSNHAKFRVANKSILTNVYTREMFVAPSDYFPINQHYDLRKKIIEKTPKDVTARRMITNVTGFAMGDLNTLWLPYNLDYETRLDELDVSNDRPLYIQAEGRFRLSDLTGNKTFYQRTYISWGLMTLLTNSMVLLVPYDEYAAHYETAKAQITFYLYRKYDMGIPNVVIIPERILTEGWINIQVVMSQLRTQLTKEEFTKSFGPVVAHYFYYYESNQPYIFPKNSHKVLGTDPTTYIPKFLARAPEADVFDFSMIHTSRLMFNFLSEAFDVDDPKSNGLKDLMDSLKQVIPATTITNENNTFEGLNFKLDSVVDAVKYRMTTFESRMESLDAKINTNSYDFSSNISLVNITMLDRIEHTDDVVNEHTKELELYRRELNEWKFNYESSFQSIESSIDTVNSQIQNLKSDISTIKRGTTELNDTLRTIDFTTFSRALSGRATDTIYEVTNNFKRSIRQVVNEVISEEIQEIPKSIRSNNIPYRKNPINVDHWINISELDDDKPLELEPPLSKEEYRQLVNRSEMGIETIKWGETYAFDNAFNQIFIFVKPKLQDLVDTPINYDCGKKYSELEILCNFRYANNSCRCTDYECCKSDTVNCSYGPSDEEDKVTKEIQSVYKFCEKIQAQLSTRNAEVQRILQEAKYALTKGRSKRIIIIGTIAAIVAISALVASGVGLYKSFKTEDEMEKFKAETNSKISDMLSRLQAYEDRFQASQESLLAIQRMHNNQTLNNRAMIEGLVKASNSTIAILNEVRTSQVFLMKKTAAVAETISHLISTITLSQTKDLELLVSLNEINIWRRAAILLKKGFLPIELLPKDVLKQTLSSITSSLKNRPYKLAWNDNEVENYYSLPLALAIEDEEKMIIKLSVPLLLKNNTYKQPFELMGFRSKWIPCPQGSCEDKEYIKYKPETGLQVMGIPEPAIIYPSDLTCTMMGDRKMCLSFTPGIIQTPDDCMKAIIKWNAQTVQSKCEFLKQKAEHIKYSPVQVTKDTYTVHRDALNNGRIILEERGEGNKLPSSTKLNITSYSSQVTIAPTGKMYDENVTWIKYNTDIITSGGEWLVQRGKLFEKDLTPKEFKAINLFELTQSIKQEENATKLTNQTQQTINDVFQILNQERPNITAEIDKYEKIIRNKTIHERVTTYGFGVSVSKYSLTWIEGILRLLARIPGWITTLSLLILAFKVNRFGLREAQIILILDGKTIELVNAQNLAIQIPSLQFLESTTNLVYIVMILILIYYAYKRGLKRQVIVNHFEGEILHAHGTDYNRYWVGRLCFNLKRSTFCCELNQKIVLWFPLHTLTDTTWKSALVSTPNTYIYSRPNTNTWHLGSHVLIRFFDAEGLVCHDSVVSELYRFDIMKINWYTMKRPRGMFYPFLEECTVDVVRDGRAHYTNRESPL